MSEFIPDFANEHRNEYWQIRKNTADVVELPAPVESVPVTTISEAIDKFSLSLSSKEKKIYDYAKIAAKLSSNNKDSIHYFSVIIRFYLESLRTTFPEKDFTLIEKSLEEIKKDLAKTVKDGNVEDNTIFIPALLGILNGII